MASNNRGRARLVTYQDRKGGWRWRILRGARVVADSGEGYARLDSLQRAIGRLAQTLAEVTTAKKLPSKAAKAKTKAA